ncbi:Acyl-CoA synthetase [Trachipleistophora hominis]|uniref:acetate--CoA ligase n=1 Tax=Trachipleistophora hominis TaxID=72359 RepID=L7JU58_TRAHO|nr:Acyl-CoA synthetase [Trachipleistophora hominis]
MNILICAFHFFNISCLFDPFMKDAIENELVNVNKDKNEGMAGEEGISISTGLTSDRTVEDSIGVVEDSIGVEGVDGKDVVDSTTTTDTTTTAATANTTGNTLDGNFNLPWNSNRYINTSLKEQYNALYNHSITNPTFFLEQAIDRLSWYKQPTKCTNNNLQSLEYFSDGTLNACYNAIDRHPPDRTALIYDNDDGTSVRYTYAQCKARVCVIAGALHALGVRMGDVVCVYMPMMDDTLFVALACARIGAVHNVVFGGYSKESVVVRIKDSGAKVLVSVVEGTRGVQRLNFYKVVEEIIKEGGVSTALIIDGDCRGKGGNGCRGRGERDGKGGNEEGRGGNDCEGSERDGNKDNGKDNGNDKGKDNGKDNDSNPIVNPTTDPITNITNPNVNSKNFAKINFLSKMNVNTDIPCTPVKAEHPLFILYTSGSTGKPKGIIHSTAGYLLYAHLTTQHCFNTSSTSVFCCTADLGWITGHTYVLYGPMCIGMVSVVVGGLPTYPDVYRMWRIVERYGVTHFYTAPTLLRLLRKLVKEEEGECVVEDENVKDGGVDREEGKGENVKDGGVDREEGKGENVDEIVKDAVKDDKNIFVKNIIKDNIIKDNIIKGKNIIKDIIRNDNDKRRDDKREDKKYNNDNKDNNDKKDNNKDDNKYNKDNTIHPNDNNYNNKNNDKKTNTKYTVPSLRNYKKTGKHKTTQYNLSSLQVLGSVGEPINKETYVWYSRTFNGRPVIDCYWQTETGGIVVCPVAYVDGEVAECAGRGFLGIRVFVIRKDNDGKDGGKGNEGRVVKDSEDKGNEGKGKDESKGKDGGRVVNNNEDHPNNNKDNKDHNNTKDTNKINGRLYSYWSDEIEEHFNREGLVLAQENELGLIVLYGSWPGMARTILNDHARFTSTYTKHGVYYTGDEGVFYRGRLFVRGRADDIINVSGHRISTAEVESVCSQYVHEDERVVEVAMVGAPDEITGLCIVLFVVGDVCEGRLRAFLKRRIGAIINPRRVYFVKDLPKTRTGKIMRRVLKGLVCGEDIGDLSTIANEECIEEIRRVIAE